MLLQLQQLGLHKFGIIICKNYLLKEYMPNCFAMIDLKREHLQDIVDKKKKVYQVADIFKVSRKTVGQRLHKYKNDGVNGLIPKKP